MILDFSEVPEGGLCFDHALEVRVAAEADEDRLLPEPVRLVGDAKPGRRGLELSGRIGTTVRLQCSRCLEAFEMPLERRIGRWEEMMHVIETCDVHDWASSFLAKLREIR